MRKSIDTTLLVVTSYPPYSRLDAPLKLKNYIQTKPSTPQPGSEVNRWFLQECAEECDLEPVSSSLWRIREDLLQSILRPKLVFMHRENLPLPSVLQNICWETFTSYKACHVSFSECLYTGGVAYSTDSHNYHNSVKKSTAKWKFHWFCYLFDVRKSVHRNTI